MFRRAQEPSDKSRYDKSYFNLLIEYNSSLARGQLPGTFEYLQVGSTEKKYPGLRVSYLHSSIFLAPKCHCDPNAYFYDDDLARKTVDAHLYINGMGSDKGCDGGGKYQKGIRFVMIRRRSTNACLVDPMVVIFMSIGFTDPNPCRIDFFVLCNCESFVLFVIDILFYLMFVLNEVKINVLFLSCSLRRYTFLFNVSSQDQFRLV